MSATMPARGRGRRRTTRRPPRRATIQSSTLAGGAAGTDPTNNPHSEPFSSARAGAGDGDADADADAENAYAGFDALLALGCIREPCAEARGPASPDAREDGEEALQAAAAVIEKACRVIEEDKGEEDEENVATRSGKNRKNTAMNKDPRARAASEKPKKAGRRMEGAESEEEKEEQQEKVAAPNFRKEDNIWAGKQDYGVGVASHKCKKAGRSVEVVESEEEKSESPGGNSEFEEIIMAKSGKKVKMRATGRKFREKKKGWRWRRRSGRSENWVRKRLSDTDNDDNSEDDDDEDEDWEDTRKKRRRRRRWSSVDDDEDDDDDGDDDEEERMRMRIWMRRMKRRKEKRRMRRWKRKSLIDSDYGDGEKGKETGKEKRAMKTHRGSVDDNVDDEEEEDGWRKKETMRRKRRYISSDDDEEEGEHMWTEHRKGMKRRMGRSYRRRDDSDDDTESMSDRHHCSKQRRRMMDTSDSESYSSDESLDDHRQSSMAPRVMKGTTATRELEGRVSGLRSNARLMSIKKRCYGMAMSSGLVRRHAADSMSHDPSWQQYAQLGCGESQLQLSLKSHGRPTKMQPPPPVDQQLSHGQQSWPSTDSSERSPTTRKTRGPTKCLKIWHLPENEHLSVSFNDMGQPIGPNASNLTTFLGTIARKEHVVPLTYSDWRAVPDMIKENMWEMVKSKFDIGEDRKGWVLMSIATKWRGYKSYLKKLYYDPLETYEERLANVPKRVHDHEQWHALVHFWSSKEWKEISAKNKANRAKLKMGHTSGTKSYARVREEERVKKPDKELPSRAELFVVTHTRKNGQPVDEASATVIAQLKERISEQLDSSQDKMLQDDIYSQVVGEERHGRIRCYGLGPTPKLMGLRRSRGEILHAYKMAQDEVHKLKEKVKDLEQKYASAEERRAAAEEINSINDMRMTSMEQTMTVLLSTIQTHIPGFDMPIPLGTRPVLNSDR